MYNEEKKCETMERIKNMGFIEKKYYDFPNIINLEVFRGECPCKCNHCPVGRIEPVNRKSHFGNKEISKETLERVISEMKLYPHSTLRIHSVGEPIMWGNLIDAIKYISEQKVKSWIFTSLVTNNKKILEALCDYCNIVEVSVNSTNAIDYINSKGIDAFDIVLKNIEYMSSYIKQHCLKTRLIVSRVQSDSELEDENFVLYWKKTGLVADAFVRKYHNYNNLLEKKGKVEKVKQPCLVHWMRFNIAYDGTVVACFNELFYTTLRKDVIMGNVHQSTIHEIWHNEKYNQLRKAELSQYKNCKNFAEDFPCRNCYSCQSYDGKRQTSEYQINQL